LADVLLNALEGNVLKTEMRWSEKASACIVLASGGYPLAYDKGKPITGLKQVSASPGIVIFHAGTKYEDGKYFTNGGRVLNICASAKTLAEALDNIYGAISAISFEGMHCRRDIGAMK
jgi:phosphoribosylamine--glycine ligase